MYKKYINFAEGFFVKLGGNSYLVLPSDLTNGFQFLQTILFKQSYPPYYRPTNFTLFLDSVSKQMVVNANIKTMDDIYICKIKNNEIEYINDKYVVYSTEKYFEIFDEMRIPVLQINLDEKNNTIEIAGLIYDDNSCQVFGNSNYIHILYPKPYLLMEANQRDSLRYIIQNTAINFIKPIHE